MPEGALPRRAPVDVAIVGAGAAGLATAIFTKRLNPDISVLLLDGAARIGAKILVSGGSRCNVTNVSVSERDFNGGKSTIVRRVLRAFSAADAAAWFASLGVSLHEEAHGKLFPDSNRSRDVLDALLREATDAGVNLAAGTRVQMVSGTNAGFRVGTSQGAVEARFVVLATGGLSLPKTGSDGAGLALARELGHTIVPTTPALVPLMLAAGAPLHDSLRGVSMEGDLAIRVDGRIERRIRGSLLWTHFGVSGPAVLDASRHWLRGELDGRATHVTLNCLPDESFERLDQRLASSARDRPRASLQTVLSERMPASAASAILRAVLIDPATMTTTLAREDRRRLSHALVEWPLAVSGSRGYNFAEATAGGVALEDIDPATMASRRCPGLYLVGEMLDVDGRIGGFNFQWAWSSARTAAQALANRHRPATTQP